MKYNTTLNVESKSQMKTYLKDAEVQCVTQFDDKCISNHNVSMTKVEETGNTQFDGKSENMLIKNSDISNTVHVVNEVSTSNSSSDDAFLT